MSKDNLFRTTDLALATFLKISGLELHSATPAKDNRNKIVFIFTDTERAVQLKKAYFDNKASVNPLEFINSYRNMKAMVVQT